MIFFARNVLIFLETLVLDREMFSRLFPVLEVSDLEFILKASNVESPRILKVLIKLIIFRDSESLASA